MAYLSKTEASAGPLLARLGFDYTDDYLPLNFADKAGTTFRAKSDWYSPTQDIYIELKHSCLNSKTTIQSANNAEAAVEPWRWKQNTSYYQVKNQWNHSAYKQAIVQQAIGADKFLVVFAKNPTADTLKLIESRGITAVSLQSLATYLGVQKLRAKGCPVAFVQM